MEPQARWVSKVLMGTQVVPSARACVQCRPVTAHALAETIREANNTPAFFFLLMMPNF